MINLRFLLRSAIGSPRSAQNKITETSAAPSKFLEINFVIWMYSQAALS